MKKSLIVPFVLLMSVSISTQSKAQSNPSKKTTTPSKSVNDHITVQSERAAIGQTAPKPSAVTNATVKSLPPGSMRATPGRSTGPAKNSGNAN